MLTAAVTGLTATRSLAETPGARTLLRSLASPHGQQPQILVRIAAR
jgi:hypothetical protein